jgi:hypothetical protein
MNILLKIFIFIGLFFGALYAQGDLFDSILKSDSNLTKENLQSSSSTSNGQLELSVKNYPKKIFKGQKFSISLNAYIANDNFDSIQTEFLNQENLEILNKESSWVLKESGVYSNTYYFVASSEAYKMPTISMKLYNAKNLYAMSSITPDRIKFVDIGTKPSYFTNLICDDLKILSVKSKEFDEKNAITVIDLKTTNGNLYDFRIKNAVDQGIDNIKENNELSEMTYFVILPKGTKELEFDYLNSSENSYKKILIPLSITDDSVSTQSNLNPKDSSFYFYKIYLYIFIIVFLIAFFLYKRKRVAIYLVVLPLYLLYDLTLNNDNGILQKNSNIYILPTENSTVFKTTEQDIKVEIINKHQNFVKVLFPDRQIGWAKKNDVK